MTAGHFLAVALSLAAVALGGACGDDTHDTRLHTYDADDASIRYTGRVDASDAKLPRFALGATSIAARFRGVGVTALLEDEHRNGTWRNYYDAVIDGVVVSKLQISTDPSTISYPIATNLPYGEHEVTVVKRTEPNAGAGTFVGFEIAGVILPPPDRPAHKMLVLGDSISAGSGMAGRRKWPERASGLGPQASDLEAFDSQSS